MSDEKNEEIPSVHKIMADYLDRNILNIERPNYDLTNLKMAKPHRNWWQIGSFTTGVIIATVIIIVNYPSLNSRFRSIPADYQSSEVHTPKDSVKE